VQQDTVKLLHDNWKMLKQRRMVLLFCCSYYC